ncbi:MAG: DMT family transporter [Ketobacter sp.]|nr:MAG: DMT family transporter [Ketobacter sp.]
MSVPAAYLVVILVWSTTPLGVQWSSQGLSPVAGALSRMFLAALLGWTAARLLKVAVPWHRQALKIYAVSNIGLFVGLICVYIGASYISSGMISVLFGLSPIASAILSRYFLREPPFSVSRWMAVLLGLCGLVISFSQSVMLTGNSYLGFLLVGFGMLCFSISGILIKREPFDMHPLAQTVGSLTLATPLYAFSGLFLGLEVESLTLRTVAAILYLTVFGSFIGFFCYFYILKHMRASSVALVTMVTPVLAISLGVYFNGEAVTPNLVIGALLICACLLLFYWGDKLVARAAVDTRSANLEK